VRSPIAPGKGQQTIAVIEEERGTHFDPQIADVLLDHREQALSLRG